MANYLFALTITPVQSFISQARKTKDLFVGSEILSGLMRETIKKIENYQEVEIIFPKNREFVSNKFIAKLENKTQKEIEDIGEILEEFIKNKFYLLGSKTLLNMQNITIDMKLFQEHFKSQMCEFFKIYWVATELYNNYVEDYKKLEQNLGAVKNLRTFKQLEQESGKKCSICGERNGLFYNSNKKPWSIIENAIRIEDNKIKGAESLCAVCFIKRFYIKKDSSYPSIAKISLLDWLNKVNNKQEFQKLFKKPFDESLYFKENLSKEYLEKWGYLKNDEDLQKAIEFLDNLEIDIKQKKHYALIQFDIDDMGKKLSSLNMEQQKELSIQLGEFAKEAENIVDKSGKTIYAGGDDFLGFVNLAYLFDVIENIRKAFKRDDLTFSTSIVIAHYKAPLHKVLDFSRELLDETKNHFDDKNGVGVIVLSDTAVNAKTICRYEEFSLLEEMKDKKIGMSLHYKLHTIFSFLDKESKIDEDEYTHFIQMIEYEIKRLLKREQGEFNQDLYKKLIIFLNNQVEGLGTRDNIKINFENFVSYLKTLEQFKKVM